MLCNIKSLTSRCLAGGGHRWISVSQTMKIYVRTVRGVIKNGAKVKDELF